MLKIYHLIAMNQNNFIVAMQFNGWNFGHLCDWMYGCKGTYPAEYIDDCLIGDCLIKRNDWVVKTSDKEFVVMTNSEFENKYC